MSLPTLRHSTDLNLIYIQAQQKKKEKREKKKMESARLFCDCVYANRIEKLKSSISYRFRQHSVAIL